MSDFRDSALPSVPRRSLLPLPPAPFAGFALALLAVLVIAVFRYRSLQFEALTAQQMTHTLEVIDQAETVLSGMKDAETGQRGFLLTGDAAYLQPYLQNVSSLPAQIDQLHFLTRNDPRQQLTVEDLRRSVGAKLDELARTIALRRAGDAAGALALVQTDRGKLLMDQVRSITGNLIAQERAILGARQDTWQRATRTSYVISLSGSAVLLLLIAAAALTTSRDYRARQRQAWVRAGLAQFGLHLHGEQRLESLGDEMLRYLAAYLEAHVGAAYVAERGGLFRRFAGYALPAEAAAEVVSPGEGLLGEAARLGRPTLVRDLPKNYWPISSALGAGAPRELVITPASVEGEVLAVLELGFLRAVEPQDLEFLARVGETLGGAVRRARDRSRLEELLDETQRQAEELRQQQEELRVTNEELEVQSRALRESQQRLEVQHAELEQSNTQLEEQTQALEDQRDALTNARDALTHKADELERSNQYKSEFLANMSHELRTPLNSTLILAKILADNKAGNLSAEQVKYANT
ncbi:MAG TPA: CHASE3 domain-containing protein, partial [Steroidobacteraceae bacterium]|nr:CHASE3 domain-containing protein [Steroidobacteraceae bacterium]